MPYGFNDDKSRYDISEIKTDIAALATGLDGANDSIGRLKDNKRYTKCLVLGDSWCRGYYQTAEHPASGVGLLTARKLGIGSNNVVDKSISATGFVTGTTFRTQLANSLDNELADVDLILIIGGQNDAKTALGAAAIKDEVLALLGLCSSRCPGADVHIIPMPFAHGRTFGVDEGTPLIGVPGSVTVLKGIGAACREYTLETDATTQEPRHNRVYVHYGAWRWATEMPVELSDDLWHLKAAGYDAWANIAAMVVRDGGDYWPFNMGLVSDFNGSGDVQQDSVTEYNGVITLRLLIHALADLPAGSTSMRLPEWCAGYTTRWITGISPNSNAALAIGNTGVDGKVTATIEFASIPADGWIIVNHSWLAGV